MLQLDLDPNQSWSQIRTSVKICTMGRNLYQNPLCIGTHKTFSDAGDGPFKKSNFAAVV